MFEVTTVLLTFGDDCAAYTGINMSHRIPHVCTAHVPIKNKTERKEGRGKEGGRREGGHPELVPRVVSPVKVLGLLRKAMSGERHFIPFPL